MPTEFAGSLTAPEFYNFATDTIDHWAHSRPQAPALWWVDHGTGAERRFTFAEIAALSSQAANFLHGAGVRPGDRVLVMLPRLPQWWTAMLGLIRLGAVPVPATLMLSPSEVQYRITTADVAAVITTGDGIAKVGDYAGLRFIVEGVAVDWIDYDDGVLDSAPIFRGERTRSDDPGILYFTSATTGEPKMVLHSQASYALGHRLTGGLWLDLRPDDLHWNISDLGWGKAAWSSFYGPWQMGACIFAHNLFGHFNPAVTLDILERYPITTWCAPPTALRRIVREDLSRRRFPHLRHCVTAGEPLNPAVVKLWREATGLTLHEAYGQTETVVLIGNFPSLGFPVRPGSMGRATPGMNVALIDETGREVPADTEGEIAVRVKPHRPLGLFQEYWRNPDEMAGKFCGDWYLTGDRATRDADGFYWFLGRHDDVIKSSGYRIGPFEVESALLTHPAVLDVAVVGKPDADRGQIVKAFVVLRPGHMPDDTCRRDLQLHCKRAIAPFKYPREVEFVASLPKTTSGKTRRGELRYRHA
ncbi:MAG: acyl--CoA ligase [Opitutaceae bacterium]|nr:acyl--CoA ligase [Opitutaceae bacterium]